MSDGTEELAEGEPGENQCGLILGCWDHEKTATLIQDLEHSVNLVERKCVQLFQELVHYKKYLEESRGENLNLPVFKERTKKWKNSPLISGSEPDIAFRKHLLNFQEIQRMFEEKFQAKLYNINEELREAAHKIGLKDNIILLHATDYLKGLNGQAQREAEKPDPYTPEKFIKLNFPDAKPKSDTVIMEHDAGEVEFSKITKNELELYQKLSRLNMKKRRKRCKLKGKKVKYCLKGKSPRCPDDSSTDKPESKRQKYRKNKLKKTVARTSRSRSPPDSSSTKCSREDFNESEIEKMCKSLNEALGIRKLHKSRGESQERERDVTVEGNESLGAAIRRAVPFTACASTSRSHNIGLNLQQLLFLSKHGRKSNANAFGVEKSQANGGTQSCHSEAGPNSKKSETEGEKGWIPDSKHDGVEKSELHLAEHRGRVWVTENNKTNFRKVRSKYTGSSREGFLEYHKSTMRQYTSGRKSMIKSESQRAYAVGSKIMVSDCTRTDFFEVGGDNCCSENASGDCIINESCSRLSTEWMRVHGSFLSMCRKYSSLKEKLTADGTAPADQELESLEEEIDCSIEKYKDFLQFYSKFLHLNHRLKSLKMACQCKVFGPVTSVSSNVHRKLCSSGPTDPAALKKTLREVQALQEKIRLVNT